MRRLWTLAACGLAAVVLVANVASAEAHNLLNNPSFERVGPSGPFTSFTGVRLGGDSAAADFSVYNLVSQTTTTDLVPTTLAGAGLEMIHVVTSAGQGGLVQRPLKGNNHNTAHFSVWVFVVQGQVGVGVGNGGHVTLTAFSTTNGVWENLTGAYSSSPVNELIIYSSVDSGMSDFYVDMAKVTMP